jgi:hypothetical protein
MFYDAYRCLSKKATGLYLRSVLLVHSNKDQHIHIKIRFSSKSTLQFIRLQTVSNQIARKLAAKTLSKFKNVQVLCSKLIHDIYSIYFTTKKTIVS